MFLLKLLFFTLNFYNLIINLEACPKGQKVTRDRSGCESCPVGYFQPEENDSQKCKICTRCDEKSGSSVEKECTKETDRKCQCRGEFVPKDNDSSTCICNVGFGLKGRECSKCEHGYFSISINSPCQQWKECKSAGVNITGTTTSDVICNPDVTTTPASNTVVSLIARLTSHPQHEGTQTQKAHTTTTSSPGHTVNPKDIVSLHPPNTGNHIGMALLIFGIVGLLVLTAVTCKLYTTTCMPRKPLIKPNDSLCRRPVEESGDCSLASLKLNSGEP